jgi:hypothetical protein
MSTVGGLIYFRGQTKIKLEHGEEVPTTHPSVDAQEHASHIMQFSRVCGTATCLLPRPSVINIGFIRYVFLWFWPMQLKIVFPSGFF